MTLGDQKQYKILTREEEIAAWEAGDRDALVESIWPFVLKTVGKFAGGNDVLFDEMISDAHLQIARAISSFDPHQSRWCSYACRFLHGRCAKVRALFYDRQADALSDKLADSLPGNLGVNEANVDAAEMLAIVKHVCTKAEAEALIRHCNGETFVDMAREKGCTRQNIELLRRNAIQRCRQYLAVQ